MDPVHLLTDASYRLSTAVVQARDLPTVVDAKTRVEALMHRLRGAHHIDSSVAGELRATAKLLVPISGEDIQKTMMSLLAAADMCVR